MNDDARKRVWFFDFDGTLSLIVPERSAAVIHPACKTLLRELASTPTEHVAVLSSRLLDDLIPRVAVAGVFLGGGSGVEWIIEGKDRWIVDKKLETRLTAAREKILPRIMKLTAISGMEIEDKIWSVAIHTRKCNDESRIHTALMAENLRSELNVRISRGPEVFEVQLLPEIDKAYGVRELCAFLGFDPSHGEIVYAGDDENDATAMEWVLQHGGVAFTVGNAPLVPGARVVESPESLAEAIHKLFRQEGENGTEVKSCISSK
jgi:trehalose 6-phosphate phosphatase